MRAGMNLRSVTSLTEYWARTAGEERVSRERRDRAGMVTYVRIRVCETALVYIYWKWWSQTSLLDLRIYAINGTEPRPSEGQ